MVMAISDSLAASSPRSSRNTTNSDDSDGLVKRHDMGLNRRETARVDVQMSGALAPREIGGTRLRPPTRRQRAALSRVVRQADHSKAIDALRRRRDEALARERGALEIIPSSMPEADSGTAKATSMAEGPKRVHGEIPKSTLEAEIEAGLAIESSLPVPSKAGRRPGQPGRLAKENVRDEDLDDFQPHDESTPFRLSTFQIADKTPTGHATSSASNSLSETRSRKRKLTSSEVQIPQSQSPIAQHQSSIPNLEIELGSNTYEIPATQEEVSEPEPELELPLTNLRRIPTPALKIWSDTMAPPRSSSPIREDPGSTRLLQIPKSKSKSKAVNTPTKPSPREQPSRNRKSTTATNSSTPKPTVSMKQRKPQPLKPISTANLQNLLPRRRKVRQRHQEDEFDLTGSNSDSESDISPTGLDEDEDELSHAVPAIQKRKGTTTTGKSAAHKSSSAKKPTYTGKTPQQPAKSQPRTLKAAELSKPSRKQSISRKPKSKPNPSIPTKVSVKEPKKTYTRHTRFSEKEKENATSALITTATIQPQPDSSSDDSNPHPLPLLTDTHTHDIHHLVSTEATVTKTTTKTSRELKTLAQKFKEVDRWRLEFEEVTASSSSPWDAR